MDRQVGLFVAWAGCNRATNRSRVAAGMPVANPARSRAGTADGGGWHSRSSSDVTARLWLPASAGSSGTDKDGSRASAALASGPPPLTHHFVSCIQGLLSRWPW